MSESIDHYLDITADVCPMTFVKTRLLIEKMASGEVLQIRLKGSEPVENVPDSVTELGHAVLSLEPEEGPDRTNPNSNEDAIYLLRVKKN